MIKPIDPDGFEAMFQRTIDPWNYESSAFEAQKRRVLVRGCGIGRRARGLELACAIGETTRVLTPLCLRLLAVDSSATAIAEAQRRGRMWRGVDFAQARLPEEMPPGPFDLIVASEIAYYLPRRALERLAHRIIQATAPGGRVVVVHHMRSFDDAAQLPVLAQARLRNALLATMSLVFVERRSRFEAAAFEKPRLRRSSSSTI